jgi:hypothetical protein
MLGAILGAACGRKEEISIRVGRSGVDALHWEQAEVSLQISV